MPPTNPLSIYEYDDTTAVDFDLVSQTTSGALYKDTSRSLAEPLSIEFKFNIGAPGSKGNDKISVIIRDTVINSTTGLVSTGSISWIISVPRDSAFTAEKAQNLAAFITHSMSNTRIDDLLDGMVP